MHTPVLLKESVELLRCKPAGVYVDATVGNGGHARYILEQHPEIKYLIGIDHDSKAVIRAGETLSGFEHKTTILQGNFRNLTQILKKAAIESIDGILFDLGVSSMQLSDPSRGFGFNVEGPLDMRMNTETAACAADLLATVPTHDLQRMLKDYGEERWAKKIASAIKKRIAEHPLNTTTELADVVARAIPSRYHPKKIHPATRTFQALRIAVNDELGALEQGLDKAVPLLSEGGRICVISFHSLEDRIVKKRFAAWHKGCTCPPGMPVCSCGKKPLVRIITKKPVTPDPGEIAGNPRARSAKLRAAEKVAAS